MNYCDWAPRLSRPDKESLRNELRGKDNSVLIDLIFLVFEETQRVNNLLERPPPLPLQKAHEALTQKYDTLLKSNEELSESYNQQIKANQELFEIYQNLLQNHSTVVNHVGNVMIQQKKSTFEELTRTIKSEEEILGQYNNLQISVPQELEYQEQINNINNTLQEIQQKSQEVVDQIKTLQNDDDQIIYDQNLDRNQIHQQQKQQKIDKINNLASQVQEAINVSNSLITTLDSLKKISKNQNLTQQIEQTLKLLQINRVIFEKVQHILKRFASSIVMYEKKVEQYKELLQKEQKIRETYQGKMEEYKRNYEKFIQSRRQNQLNQQGNFTINFRKLKLVYKILFLDLSIILYINSKSD